MEWEYETERDTLYVDFYQLDGVLKKLINQDKWKGWELVSIIRHEQAYVQELILVYKRPKVPVVE